MSEPRSRNIALVWAAGWLAFAGVLYFVLIPAGVDEPSYASQSPRAFPQILAVLIAVSAIALFVLEWRGLQPRRTERFTVWFLFAPAVSTLYALALKPLGFTLATAAVLAVLFFSLGERRWLIVAGISLVIAFGIYLAFVHLMNVPLPAGILG